MKKKRGRMERKEIRRHRGLWEMEESCKEISNQRGNWKMKKVMLEEGKR